MYQDWSELSATQKYPLMMFNHFSPILATQRLKDIFCDNPSKLYLEVAPLPPLYPASLPISGVGEAGRYKNQSRVV